ncbi:MULTISPECIES: AI-2E family transporter [Mycobacterium avium complex (MAC)]|uniref:AI-2E family transporter n=8 Tax=Mycobacterium avium complex (MAC) TaxID=120793 RepID=A0A2A3L873_MYCAV|nr:MULTISPECIES: AI-2E family transporter [Mycobacterium avium complex (MAC)]ETA96007.1 membrane protein [Mycobacterium avium 05-4293]ETB15898.1 membrane protein [Mycobacterium avium subsp. silvaticum ATCC 49884]ETB24397.1 membrane protein [Mycobacterium avium subsp. avium 11-4751]ETB29918.1 membrane protein [Mycobacterium avium 09-5983]ETB33075.1 membrane protein [Mycobacterium avium subsp. hominissuis 10-4249]ETB45290.1 membrane protein [Mycobacterium avium subsp. hominissuis 10-5606]ETB52
MSANVDDASVEPIVRKTAAWAWRLLVILAAALALFWVLAKLEVIVVPVLVALLLSALLVPVVDWLDRHGLPRGGAVALVLLGGFAILGGILAFVVLQFIDGLPGLTEQVTQSIESTRRWLINGPAHLRSEQIDSAGNAAIEALHNNQAKLTSGALSTAATVTELVTAAVLVLFTLIFFLYGGRNIWRYVVQIVPAHARERVHEAGSAGYGSLIGYVRATFLVALTDAAGVGAGLAIMGIPLALPLASLVFLGAFIPLVGAVVAGFLAVVVALLAKGIVYALITLGLLVAVNQIEAHLLQPLVMGRAVSIHPLAVVLAISTGGVLAGIVGALLAVPTVAFLNNAFQVLLAPNPSAEAVKQEEESDEQNTILQAEPDKPENGSG